MRTYSNIAVFLQQESHLALGVSMHHAIKEGTWYGRVDSDSDFDTFCWHHWVLIDIECHSTKLILLVISL
jgi:hypothetical protein